MRSEIQKPVFYLSDRQNDLIMKHDDMAAIEAGVWGVTETMKISQYCTWRIEYLPLAPW